MASSGSTIRSWSEWNPRVEFCCCCFELRAGSALIGLVGVVAYGFSMVSAFTVGQAVVGVLNLAIVMSW